MSTTRPPVTPALNLPDTFAFSQSSLQSYVDCPRRFWLAYVEQLPWPAVEASPVADHEQLMRLGSTFHLLMERAQIGIDGDLLAAGLEPPLSHWFDAYRRHQPADLPTDFVEIERILTIPFGLSTPLAHPQRDPTAGDMRYRLAAKYDLIATEKDGRVIIIDWKTTRKRTDPATLRQRLQTIVYPYVLVEASAGLPWGPVLPEQIEMRYWFTATPGQPVVFRYDGAQHAANHEHLQRLLQEIFAGHRERDFEMVMDTDSNRKHLCNYCVYRSRCNRGLTAGSLDDIADTEDFFAVDVESALEFTLDDVTELAF